MKRKVLLFTKKFAISIAALYSLFIVAQAILFNYTLNLNSQALQATVMEAQNALLTDTANLIVYKAALKQPTDTLQAAAMLKHEAGKTNDVLHIIIFAPTEDESYFKPMQNISLAGGATLGIDKGPISLGSQWLRKGLASAVADPAVYEDNGCHWKNVFVPMTIGKAKFSVMFMFAAEAGLQITKAFNSATNRSANIMLVATALLVLGVICVTMLFSQSHSFLMRRLASTIQNAADGNLDVKITAGGDKEIDAIAASFNTLIDELKAVKTEPQKEQSVKPEQPSVEKSEEKPTQRDAYQGTFKTIFKYGVSLLKENKPVQALGIFGYIISIDGNSFGAYFNSGVALAKIGKYQDAITMLKTAQSINPAYETTASYIHRLQKLIVGGVK